MCTFKNEHTVMVCNIAIQQVREHLQEAFGKAVQYTTVDGQGTLVQAMPTINATHFQEAAREAIAVAQASSAQQ